MKERRLREAGEIGFERACVVSVCGVSVWCVRSQCVRVECVMYVVMYTKSHQGSVRYDCIFGKAALSVWQILHSLTSESPNTVMVVREISRLRSRECISSHSEWSVYFSSYLTREREREKRKFRNNHAHTHTPKHSHTKRKHTQNAHTNLCGYRLTRLGRTSSRGAWES